MANHYKPTKQHAMRNVLGILLYGAVTPSSSTAKCSNERSNPPIPVPRGSVGWILAPIGAFSSNSPLWSRVPGEGKTEIRSNEIIASRRFAQIISYHIMIACIEDNPSRLEICRDRWDRRSCKIFPNCVKFWGNNANLLGNYRVIYALNE